VLGWRTTIDGTAGDWRQDPIEAGVDRVWYWGDAIAEYEYDYLLAVRDWAAVNAPDHPCLDPSKPIRPALLSPLPPRTRS
jgi:hypothetical protein